MIRDALAWWSGQMLDLVPTRFIRPDPSEAGALVVEPGPAGARLCIRQNGNETVFADLPLTPDAAALVEPGSGVVPVEAADAEAFAQAVSAARGPSRSMPVVLRLPSRAALRRDVVLPLAAEAGLDGVLTYEMDRLTPFSAAETFFSHSVTGRDRASGRVFVQLILVPRATLQPLLSVLSAAGADAQAIEVAAADGDRPGMVAGGAGQDHNRADGQAGRQAGGGGVLRIPLAYEAPAAARRQRLLLRAAGAGCAVLALLAVSLPFALQQSGFHAVDRRIVGLRAEVQAVQSLQSRIAGGSAGATLVRAERARLGDALVVMAAITTVLPDDSYLTDLTLRRGQLTVSGQSPSAARLIPAISADPHFSAPAFSAPVTRIEGQGQELFSIKAGVAH